VIARAEIKENEFNLNLPRYVDTFEPERVLPLAAATAQLASTTAAAAAAQTALQTLLAKLIAPEAREGGT
jgi:type I restriction enzyme M protein